MMGEASSWTGSDEPSKEPSKESPGCKEEASGEAGRQSELHGCAGKASGEELEGDRMGGSSARPWSGGDSSGCKEEPEGELEPYLLSGCAGKASGEELDGDLLIIRMGKPSARPWPGGDSSGGKEETSRELARESELHLLSRKASGEELEEDLVIKHTGEPSARPGDSSACERGTGTDTGSGLQDDGWRKPVETCFSNWEGLERSCW